MCLVDEGEGWDFYRDEWRRCAKPFLCYECSRDVERGERYFYAAGVLAGESRWDVYKLCEQCRAIACQWLMGQCGGWLYGGVWEDLDGHRGEIVGDLDLGRALVGMRRKWRKRDGSLMAVPRAA